MGDATMPSFLPSGDLQVPQPEGDAAWSECLRDLKRTFEGGSLSVLGRGRRFTVHDPAKVLGDVSHKACEEALDELANIIEFERQAQAMGLSPEVTTAGACWHPGCVRPARHEGPCVDGSQRLELPEGCEDALTPELLKASTHRVAANICVVPGMQAVMNHELPPALWQPSFVVCVGNGQVRVLTVAFVGEPVCGDRPSSKSTPYVLRLLTDDLVRAESQGPSRYCVRHALANAPTMALHLADLDAELFEAAETGDWTSITKVAQTRHPSVSSERTPSAGPQQSLVTPATGESRELGDSASPEPVQMQPAQHRCASPALPSPSPSLQVTLSGSQTPPPEVSILADGLSVKAVTSALNNMSNGAKLANMFVERAKARAKAQSPGQAFAGWRARRNGSKPKAIIRGVLTSPPPQRHLRGVLASPQVAAKPPPDVQPVTPRCV